MAGRWPQSATPLLEARQREAALIKARGRDDPEVQKAIAARRRLAAEQHIAQLLAEFPPLSEEDKANLARLLVA
jgi:hypothetical protein